MPESETKEAFEKVKKFFSNKKVQWAITAIILLVIIFTSVSVRLSNLPNLIDTTTGNYTLSDPDALLWLRLEHTLLQNGSINGVDTMRYPPLQVKYFQELLVYVIVDAYKIIHSFNSSVTLGYLDTIYPAYAFLIGLVIFFFLIYILTKSKSAAILASAFLAYAPAYLFRTISGVSGHEALGVMFLFAVFLVFVLGIKKFHKNWKHAILWGILLGVLTAYSFASWGGTLNFIFLILPSASLLYYLFHIDKEETKIRSKFIVFYSLWIIASVLTTYLVHSHPSALYPTFFSATGILVPAVLLFVLVDTASYRIKKINESKHRLLISFIATLVIGIIFMEIFGKGGFNTIVNVYKSLIHPLGTERVALTVAYYAQPYLQDFQAQTGLMFFWMFLLGMSIIWIDFVKGIKSLKQRIYISLAGIAAICGILFSRYSSTSILDGVSFLSQAIFFLGLAILLISLIWIYKKERHKIGESEIFIFCWMLIMLITTRAAQRTIFMVVPFVAFAGAYLILKTASYTKASKGKDRVYLIGAFLILTLVISFVYLFGNPFGGTAGAYTQSAIIASQTGPLTNDQWQHAMAWVRNNTAPDSIFLHWWDYGYILQTIGLRPTVLDGGNYNIYWDHLMGRYVLTTPNPNSALSFMKSQNVSYLLIDFTDFGKYAAYSKIGSDDVSGLDRYSAPTLMAAAPSQDYTDQNGTTTRIFQGTTFVDQDIYYNNQIIPGPTLDSKGNTVYNSFVIGATLQYMKITNSSAVIIQPSVVVQYNGQQIVIPIRYSYYGGRISDYGTGINATLMIVPSLNVLSNGQVQIDNLGAAIYLSPKVAPSLYAQLYLMNDPNHEYPTLVKADFEENAFINLLKVRGTDIGEFAYYQGQLLAPLKIWKVNYSSNILDIPEFRQPQGNCANGVYCTDLDNATFVSS